MKMSMKNYLAIMALMAVVGGDAVYGMKPTDNNDHQSEKNNKRKRDFINEAEQGKEKQQKKNNNASNISFDFNDPKNDKKSNISFDFNDPKNDKKTAVSSNFIDPEKSENQEEIENKAEIERGVSNEELDEKLNEKALIIIKNLVTSLNLPEKKSKNDKIKYDFVELKNGDNKAISENFIEIKENDNVSFNFIEVNENKVDTTEEKTFSDPGVSVKDSILEKEEELEKQPAVEPVNEQVIVNQTPKPSVLSNLKDITLVNLEIKNLNQEKQELLEKQKIDKEKGSINESSFINKIKVGGSMLAGALVLSISLYYGSGDKDLNAFSEVFLISGALLGLGAHKLYACFVPKK